MVDDNTGALTPEHAAFLKAQAVDVKLALSLGVRSLTSRADNPQDGVWANWANHPAILFPWTNEEGRTEFQVRPDNPTKDSRGRDRKYVFHKDMTPVLWAVRVVPGASKVVIIEGTKQCLAGASYAPAGVSVYGIAGCRMWQVKGMPIPDLNDAVDGKEVVVILDADAAENPQVFDAGVELAKALDLEGASKVTFGRLSGGGTSGLDDILAAKRANQRAPFLARVIAGARPKPAESRPKGKRKGGELKTTGDRVQIIVNRDRRSVIDDLTSALKTKWNAIELFCHGGVISRRRKDQMKPVDRGSFHDLIQDTAVTVNENDGANGVTYSYTWPDPGTMAATMSQADQFAPLDRISHAPFVRPDGTVVTEAGYDESTRTLLLPDPVFEGLKVPEEPSPAEVTAARELILTEWLGDFPFDSDIDRANALALIITPAVRGMVPKVPLAVIDGLQMGVGKNLLADSVLTVYTGSAAEPMNWVSEPEELRKQITAAFRGGSEFFVFDEAHTVEGAPLAQALTASTWQDRILGVSTMANFPNVITWMSLGNQVQVKGDLTRRVYRIALRPRYANPQDRAASSFRHPGQSGLDLLSWTRKHRAELMIAILTLVRAWFAQGQPRPERGISFGSFEAWERISGGIVETAGLEGFLGNLKVWRSESDFDTQYWTGHLKWLRELFGAAHFRTAQVREKALTDPAGFLAPPKLDDPADKGFGKALGEAYSRLRDRRYDGYWIERVSAAHGNVSQWTVHCDEEELPPPPSGPPTDPEPDPEPKGWLIEHTDNHVPNGVTDLECTFCPNPEPRHAGADGACPDYGSTLDPCPPGCASGTCVAGGNREPDRTPEPAPENEHAEARGPAPEDTDGEGHDEVRRPAAVVDLEAPGLLAEMERALAAEGLDPNGDPLTIPVSDSFDEEGNGELRTAYGEIDSEESIQVTMEFGPADPEAFEIITGLDPETLEETSLEAGLLAFDLETGDADDLYRTPGEDYVRIGGTAADDGQVIAYGREHVPAADLVASDIRESRTITGHNIMAFDLPALVRADAMTMPEIHRLAADGRLFDALLVARYVDPPMARDKGVDVKRRYDLGTLAQTYDLGGEKLSDVSKPLAKKYGGWGAIPIDVNDPDLERADDAGAFIGYMVQDVELSRRLHTALLERLGGTLPDYLVREHRVAAIAAQIRHNGFLVDQPLLAERVTEVNERKRGSLEWLVENIGLPINDAKGKPYKSPLASKLGKEVLEDAFREAGATSFWRTGVSGDFATSADHMRHLAEEYHHLPQVREIAKNVYRIVGARSVYQTAQDHLCPDGRVHTKIGFEQATGRWSVTQPGLTVFGKRGGRHVERAVFLPDPGEVLISADLSQVDMRAVAGLSQDQAYIEMLKTDDPHTDLAIALFGDAGYREQAKAIGHGWNYGESLRRISEENEIEPGIVRRFDASMHERFPRLVMWRDEVRAIAESGALLDNGFGRLMRADPQRAHTQAPALSGQGCARDLMMEGLLRLPAEILPMLRAQIHDEVVLSVPADQAEEIGRAVVGAMTFEWRGVPIMADVSRPGTNWSECYIKS